MRLAARLEAWVLAGGALFLGGMALGWALRMPRQKAPEPPAARVIQPDGSLILARRADAEARPAQMIPKGAKVERLIQVVVQPNRPAEGAPAAAASPNPSASAASAPGNPPCPPVRVDLTVVRLPDATHRVLVSSPDGTVLDGVDIPVEPTRPEPKPLKWAAGAVYGTTAQGGKSQGAFLDRDFTFLHTGAELTRNTYATANRQGWEFRVRLGIRF